MTTSLDTVIIRTVDVDNLVAFYGAGLEQGEPEQPGPVTLWFRVDDPDRNVVGLSQCR